MVEPRTMAKERPTFLPINPVIVRAYTCLVVRKHKLGPSLQSPIETLTPSCKRFPTQIELVILICHHVPKVYRLAQRGLRKFDLVRTNVDLNALKHHHVR